MPVPPSSVVEFPAMLHGSIATVSRAVEAQGQAWAREYLQTGVFTSPRRMLPVPPGELLEVIEAALFDATPHYRRWRLHMFGGVSMSLDEGIPKEERSGMEQAFETFCLSAPWGALYHVVRPPPPWSAERMAQRFAALVRFWDTLQGLRYAFREIGVPHTLESLVESIYRPTLEAWCPGGPTPVREHLALTAERMMRATRAECVDAVLRIAPGLIAWDSDFEHPELFSDPNYLRERLGALSPEDFGTFSGTYKYMIVQELGHWDRALGRH